MPNKDTPVYCGRPQFIERQSHFNMPRDAQVSLSQGCYSLKFEETFDIRHNWKDQFGLQNNQMDITKRFS